MLTKPELQAIRHLLRVEIRYEEYFLANYKQLSKEVYVNCVKPESGEKTEEFIHLNELRNQIRKSVARLKRLRKLSVAIKDELKMLDGK